MSEVCESVSLEFSCPCAKVWDALCDASTYERWYGYPYALKASTQDGELRLGAKICFEGRAGTSVVTAFEPNARLTIGSSAESNDFELVENENGCTVRLTTVLAQSLDWNGTDKARARANREILRSLRRVCGAVSASEQDSDSETPAVPEYKAPSIFSQLLANLARGYKSPLKSNRSSLEDTVKLGRIMDNTESSVAVHPRAAAAAVIMFALLFGTLLYCSRFKTNDIVPSTGLSLTQSEGVNKANVERIAIGQSRDELELMLGCAGLRLSGTEYYYRSADELASGVSGCSLFVTYDAYGSVRRYGFIDNARAREPYTQGIHDVALLLDSTMDASECERVVGQELSAFWVDKKDVTVVHFGRLDITRSIFDPLLVSELTVRLNAEENYATAQFYTPYDPNNTMEYAVTSEKLSRQYKSDTNYRADRLAYERIFLLLGKTRTQVDAVLGTEGVDYAATFNDAVICSYSSRSSVSDEAQYRYRYNITFASPDDTAVNVTMQNGYLEAGGRVLLDRSEYALRKGMTLYELYSQLCVLPTYAELNAETFTLCYGQRNETEDGYEYDLTVTLDYPTRSVADYRFYTEESEN